MQTQIRLNESCKMECQQLYIYIQWIRIDISIFFSCECGFRLIIEIDWFMVIKANCYYHLHSYGPVYAPNTDLILGLLLNFIF